MSTGSRVGDGGQRTLLNALEARFNDNPARHEGISWADVLVRLDASPEALEARKKNKPDGSAVGLAGAMGVSLLTEAEYRRLQELGEFDTTTSSWLLTPQDVRELGGALFGDCRYGAVFVYHNGAQSYYATRGFRGSLRV